MHGNKRPIIIHKNGPLTNFFNFLMFLFLLGSNDFNVVPLEFAICFLSTQQRHSARYCAIFGTKIFNVPQTIDDKAPCGKSTQL